MISAELALVAQKDRCSGALHEPGIIFRATIVWNGFVARE
jgi:hypothetical protein